MAKDASGFNTYMYAYKLEATRYIMLIGIVYNNNYIVLYTSDLEATLHGVKLRLFPVY